MRKGVSPKFRDTWLSLEALICLKSNSSIQTELASPLLSLSLPSSCVLWTPIGGAKREVSENEKNPILMEQLFLLKI